MDGWKAHLVNIWLLIHDGEHCELNQHRMMDCSGGGSSGGAVLEEGRRRRRW